MLKVHSTLNAPGGNIQSVINQSKTVGGGGNQGIFSSLLFLVLFVVSTGDLG